MGPGGRVVAVASEEGGVVTNGMSQYSRAEFNANSGLVVDITPERDYPGHPLACIALQRKFEELAFKAGGSNYQAPGQKLGDFLADKPRSEEHTSELQSLMRTSYAVFCLKKKNQTTRHYRLNKLIYMLQ